MLGLLRPGEDVVVAGDAPTLRCGTREISLRSAQHNSKTQIEIFKAPNSHHRVKLLFEEFIYQKVRLVSSEILQEMKPEMTGDLSSQHYVTAVRA